MKIELNEPTLPRKIRIWNKDETPSPTLTRRGFHHQKPID
jgi:hypothetical protein